MDIYLDLEKQKNLPRSLEYEERQDLSEAYMFEIFKLLTLRGRMPLVRGVSLEAVLNSKKLEKKGISFQEVKDELKSRWPTTTNGLNNRRGHVEFYARPGKKVNVFVNQKRSTPWIFHLSQVFNDAHFNAFLLYGSEAEVTPLKNLIDAFSNQMGYYTQGEEREATIIQFRREAQG